MSPPVVLRPEALDDIETTQAWYDRRQPGLGRAFVEQFSDSLIQISESPELHGIVGRGVRFHRMKRFPYVVYFRIRAESIEVIAVLHGGRDSSVWRRRT